MIPISDDNPAQRPAFVTWTLIAISVVAYLWELSLGGDMNAALYALGFMPAKFFAEPGAEIAISPVLTIFNSMFLHGGFLHLAGNMLYLWIFGNNVEDALGHTRYLFFYLACGAAAALTMAYLDRAAQVPMVGASGAISGVLAAYVLLYPRARVTVIVPLGILLYPFAIAAGWVIGFWFLLQLVSAALADPGQPGTAWWAHVGGFAAGLFLTPILKRPSIPVLGQPRRGPWNP